MTETDTLKEDTDENGITGDKEEPDKDGLPDGYEVKKYFTNVFIFDMSCDEIEESTK